MPFINQYNITLGYVLILFEHRLPADCRAELPQAAPREASRRGRLACQLLHPSLSTAIRACF